MANIADNPSAVSNPMFPKVGQRKSVPPPPAADPEQPSISMSPTESINNYIPNSNPPMPQQGLPKEINSDDHDSGEKGAAAGKRPSRSAMNSCGMMICGSNQMVSKYDREEYIRVTLVELAIYLIYLVITCMITYGMTSSDAYYYTNVVSRIFLDIPFGPGAAVGVGTTFRTSASIEDFWAFTETTMVHGLYWKYWYGVQDVNNIIPDRHQGILHENKLLGRARLRQIRVTVESCPVSDKFQNLVRECYPPYHESHEEKKPYYQLLKHLDAWKYHSEKELNGTSYWGQLATYSGAGAYQLLGTDKDETLQIIMQLKNSLWITRATRVVFLDFTMHNANVDLFCIVKLIWEFPPTGGLITSWDIRTVKMAKYTTTYEYFLLVLEFIFCAFTLYYTFQEFYEMCSLKCGDYWGSCWSYIDIITLGLSYCCIAYNIFRYYIVHYVLQKLVISPITSVEYLDFYRVVFWESLYSTFISLLVFFTWIKLFKFISFNKTMTQLSTTMSRCTKDIGGFAIMFFIVFFAFAQLGYLLFGTRVEDFRTFHDTVFSLLRLILGDFNFRAIESANRVIGPIYFIAYVFFVFFVLLNMFLAIINDTYGEVKAENKARGQEYQVTDYIKGGFSRLFSFCRKKNGPVDAEGQMKLKNSENIIKTDELRANLHTSQYSDVEIEMFLARFELDEERPIDVEEAEYVLGSLEGRHVSNEKGSDVKPPEENVDQPTKDLTDEEISELQSRVGILESSLTGVTRKLDTLVHQLESIANMPTNPSRRINL